MQIYDNCPKSDNFRNNEILKDSILIFNKLFTCKYLAGVWMLLILLALGNRVIAGTITSKASGNWSASDTWVGGLIPTINDDVIIDGLIVLDGPDIFCNNLTINATTGRLTVNPGTSITINALTNNRILEIISNNSGSGSVIYNSVSGSGTIYFERYMTGTTGGVKKWHIFSAPGINFGFGTFFDAAVGNYNIIEQNTTHTYWSFGKYLETPNKWDYPFLTTGENIAGNFTAGKGYGIALKSDDKVRISGYAATSPVTVPITFSTGTEPPGGFGWNSLGNPFTSAINVKKYIDANIDQLDGTYGGLYIWNPAGYYEVTSLAPGGLTDLQVGQGFVTRSKVGGGTITFTYDMREHAPSAAFKAATLPWPSIQLKAETQGLVRTTLVNFNSGMTVGIDPFYDAGLLRAGSNLEIYTRLIDDSGNDLAIQCLPDAGFDKMVIPVSIDLTTAGEVTFSAKSLNLPAGCQPVLEDRVAGVSTSLSTEDAVYKVNLPANTNGIKRFYLHLNGITSAINNEDVLKLKVYAIGKEIHIQGDVSEQTVANLYDLFGREIGTYQVPASDNSILNIDGVANGFYLLRIMEGNKPKFVGKIRLQ